MPEKRQIPPLPSRTQSDELSQKDTKIKELEESRQKIIDQLTELQQQTHELLSANYYLRTMLKHTQKKPSLRRTLFAAIKKAFWGD